MKRKIIPYNPKLRKFAKQLRQNMTLSEVLLWDQLKQKKMKGFDFDRQRPINEFIVDFYCKDLMLAIEVDGEQHNSYNRHFHGKSKLNFIESIKRDSQKELFCERNKIKLVRIYLSDNIKTVEKLRNFIKNYE